MARRRDRTNILSILFVCAFVLSAVVPALNGFQKDGLVDNTKEYFDDAVPGEDVVQSESSTEPAPAAVLEQEQHALQVFGDAADDSGQESNVESAVEDATVEEGLSVDAPPAQSGEDLSEKQDGGTVLEEQDQVLPAGEPIPEQIDGDTDIPSEEGAGGDAQGEEAPQEEEEPVVNVDLDVGS